MAGKAPRFSDKLLKFSFGYTLLLLLFLCDRPGFTIVKTQIEATHNSSKTRNKTFKSRYHDEMLENNIISA